MDFPQGGRIRHNFIDVFWGRVGLWRCALSVLGEILARGDRHFTVSDAAHRRWLLFTTTLESTGFTGILVRSMVANSPNFSWQGATIAATVMALPLMFKTTKAALQSVNPIYLEAAATLGQSEWQIFWRVWLPLANRGVLVGILLSFTRALGEFGATLMVAGNIPGLTQTMPMAIYEAVQTGDQTLAAIFVAILTGISFLSLLMTQYLESRTATKPQFFR